MLQQEFSEEKVYKRMVKVAQEVWDMNGPDMNSIDPLVRLLMRGLSKEIEKIGSELQNSETRILKRIANQLMPDQLQNAMPSHSIVHFSPTENTELTRYDHFSFEKKWKNKAKFNRMENRTLNFTPAGTFPANTGKIAYRIDLGKVYEVKGLRKNFLCDAEGGANRQEIVLGIENASPGTFYLYFDWVSEKSTTALFSSLSKTSVSTLSGKLIKTTWGFKVDENARDYFEEKTNTLLKLEKNVIGYYQRQFLKVEITGEQLQEAQTVQGAGYESLHQELGLEEDAGVSWLKIGFPKELDAATVSEAMVQMNCFPVLNRKLCRQVFRLQPELNIRKLDFDGHFLSMERVETGRGEIYMEQDALRNQERLKGTFSVRTGSMGRIDERDGQGYLKYLLDLLREEKQAFASANVSSTIEDLNTIGQTIEKIEKRITHTGSSSVQPFILLTPIKNFENIFVHFWSTDGEFANGIHANGTLECKTSGISTTGQAIFLKNSIGGTDGLIDAELIRNYKNAILTKESIVTHADIKSLGFSIGGKAISDIEVKKEIVASNHQGVGLVQQITIYIKFRESTDDEVLKDYIVKRFEAEIENKSNFSMPLSVRIKK